MDTIQSLPLHQPAPLFTLPDLDGNIHYLSDYVEQVVVINFWSAECPWVERVDRQFQPWLEAWGEGVKVLRVASNANESPDLLRKVSYERKLPLVLLDTDQAVADLYCAITTPHLFVVDSKGWLRYHGPCDDVTFRQRTPTHYYVKDAVEALLKGDAPTIDHVQPSGCMIVRRE